MRLTDWHDTWLAADPRERDRLREQLAAPQLATEEPLLAPGGMVGPYRIVSLLARGGMGDVYRATDVRLHRDVALKVLSPGRTGDMRRAERFVQEARVTASLDHPNIVKLFDIGLADGRPYFVAELLDGETLRARIERGAMPVDEAVRIGAEIARGLVAAHAAGSVHRDLKPENIFLTRSGVTKILDFGIAKLAGDDETTRDGLSTLTGIVLGTAGYLAPEQIRGSQLDGRADLFALGAILFEMLTGRRAFARAHLVDTLHAILYEPPPDLLGQKADVPPGFAGIVTRLLEKAPEARFQSAADLVSALDEPAAAPRVLGWRTAAVAAVVVAALASAGWYYRRAATPPAPAANAGMTLAIFPFRSLPEGADAQLLELGLADVFISRLNQLPGFRVLPLSATERLRDADPAEAGRKLGADRVLTGTVQRDENRVRASVQLLSTSEGRAIWTNTFDADAATVFSIQDAVVTRVLDEIAPRLSVEARTRLARPGTRSNEAFEASLRGRAYATRSTHADLSRAIGLFREAVTFDPKYADAWASLALAYRRVPIVGDAPTDVPFLAAKRAAARALELEPDHAEAHAAQGTIALWYDWDYRRAEELLRRAVTLQPGSAEAQAYLAHLLSDLGRHDEALAEIRRARELDPTLPIARSLEGQFLFMARRYDESLRSLNAMAESDPRFVPGRLNRAYPLIALRRYDEAIADCDLVLGIEATLPDAASAGPRAWPRALRAYALARSGRRAEAEQVLASFHDRARHAYVPPHHEALVLHALGRDAEALVQLTRAVDVRDVFVTFLGVDPKWDGLRASPEFQALLTRVNLLDVSNRVLATFR